MVARSMIAERPPAAPPDRAPWLAAALAFAVALPFAFVGAEFYDELTYLGHAQRILAGEVIYRDFFEFLAPLSSYLGAALFVVTGPSVGAARVVAALAIALAAYLAARLVRL